MASRPRPGRGYQRRVFCLSLNTFFTAANPWAGVKLLGG